MPCIMPAIGINACAGVIRAVTRTADCDGRRDPSAGGLLWTAVSMCSVLSIRVRGVGFTGMALPDDPR
jgi:hypothetical protein